MSTGFASGITLVLTAAVLMSAQTSPPVRHTIDETERLAKAALAADLEVPLEGVSVGKRGERHWPDADLGCAPRKGVFEPVPTPGYVFILRVELADYEMRADRFGHVRRCPPPGRGDKPVGPPGKSRPPGA